MSTEKRETNDGELSIYGEILDALGEIGNLRPGEFANLRFDAEEETAKRADFIELTDIIKRDELTLDDLNFLYRILTGAARTALDHAMDLRTDCGPISFSFSGIRDWVFAQLLSVIDQAEARVRHMGIATPDLLSLYANVRRLYANRPEFIRKIVEAAFNDATIRAQREMTSESVRAAMHDRDTPAGGDDETIYDA